VVAPTTVLDGTIEIECSAWIAAAAEQCVDTGAGVKRAAQGVLKSLRGQWVEREGGVPDLQRCPADGIHVGRKSRISCADRRGQLRSDAPAKQCGFAEQSFQKCGTPGGREPRGFVSVDEGDDRDAVRPARYSPQPSSSDRFDAHFVERTHRPTVYGMQCRGRRATPQVTGTEIRRSTGGIDEKARCDRLRALRAPERQQPPRLAPDGLKCPDRPEYFHSDARRALEQRFVEHAPIDDRGTAVGVLDGLDMVSPMQQSRPRDKDGSTVERSGKVQTIEQRGSRRRKRFGLSCARHAASLDERDTISVSCKHDRARDSGRTAPDDRYVESRVHPRVTHLPRSIPGKRR
jgi:hypothetical protein